MAGRKSKKGGGGPARPVKGFRPGKVPPHIQRRQAKAQLPTDAGWAQKQMVDAVAGRSPSEVRAMLRKWTLVLLGGAAVLALAGALLYSWSVVAGVVVHLITAALLFLGYRLRKQGRVLVEIAESLR